MKKAKMVLWVSVIVIELAAVFIIAKAIATDSSPTQGLLFLSFGLVLLMIGMTRKSKNAKADAN